MKISEFESKLAEIKAKHGDIEIYISNTDPTDFTVKLKLEDKDISVGNPIDDSVDDPEELGYTMNETEGEDQDFWIGPRVVLLNLDY